MLPPSWRTQIRQSFDLAWRSEARLGLLTLLSGTQYNRLADSWTVLTVTATLPPRSTAGQLTLDQHIGVRIPGGQPKQLKEVKPTPTEDPNCDNVANNVASVGQNAAAPRRSRSSPNFPQTLEAVVADFVRVVRSKFAHEVAHDPKALKSLVLRLVRKELPPRRGRPNDPRIDAAVRMFEQGKPTKEILRLQTRGFDKLDDYGRYLAEKGLRMAIARRRKRAESTRKQGRSKG